MPKSGSEPLTYLFTWNALLIGVCSSFETILGSQVHRSFRCLIGVSIFQGTDDAGYLLSLIGGELESLLSDFSGCGSNFSNSARAPSSRNELQAA